MKRMTLPAILAAAVLAFALAGCSSAQPMTEDTLKGVWKAENSNLGFESYINFGDDKVVECIIGEGWLDGEWSVSGTEGKIVFTDYSEMMMENESGSSSSSSSNQAARTGKLTYSGGKLTLGSDNGSKLVFSKDDSAEAKALFEYGYEVCNEVNFLINTKYISIFKICFHSFCICNEIR